jgi:hypothetical protein
MSQQVDGPFRSFTAGAALGRFLRVKLTSGKLALAGATDRDLGTIEEAAFADGDLRRVRLASSDGTVKMVAAASFSAGAVLYAAANGKVTGAVGGVVVGVALEAATADNDIIEVFRTTLNLVEAAAIADPSGGATVDSQARTAIGSILTALRNAGLVAT